LRRAAHDLKYRRWGVDDEVMTVGRSTPQRRRPLGAVTSWPRPVLAAVVALTLWLPGAAAAQQSADLERRLGETEQEARELRSGLDELRDEIAAVGSELARIGARLDDARGRLRLAEGQVALAEVALEEARDAREVADAAHRRSEAQLTLAEQELEEQEALFVDQLVRTFKYGTVGATRGAMVIEVLRRAEDPNAFAVGMKQLRAVVDDQDQTVQRVFALREARSARAQDAARARSRAAQAAAAAQETLAVVEELLAAAEALAAEIAADEREQRRILDSLTTTEGETAALLEAVADQQRTLQTQLGQQRAREEAQRRRDAEQAAQQGTDGTAVEGRLGLPGAAGGPDIAGIRCPVLGAVANRDFSNDWGYPRSGGRSHQGNDIFAARGTPVIAVDDGVVTAWNPPAAPTSLGGITLTYRTADGSEWYNAHLDTIADGVVPGAVLARGQVIGTVGNSGNARTTPPHLHLGRRLGGSWVNPWPTIAPACG
jgi:murein DD-endopeptidase MepM/ murein hydrolase activator NlpD